MKICVFKILVFTLMIAIHFQSMAQHIENDGFDMVFIDNANVRELPSINSKIIGQLTHNTVVSRRQTNQWEVDTISGTIDYWIPIWYNSQKAFIWRPVLAKTNIKSRITPNYNILLNFTKQNNLEFKIFNNDSLIAFQTLNRKNKAFLYASNLGKTYNSKGNEIFVVVYDTNQYELFEWNGKSLITSSIKLNDDSFITNKNLEFKNGIINSNIVNIRQSPDSTSKIIGKATLNTQVEIIKLNFIEEIKSHKKWHSVKWNGKTGYIREEFLDIPIYYIRNNYKEGEAFLLTDKSIYVFVNNEIKDNLKHWGVNTEYETKDKFYYAGNKGFDSTYQFLAICRMANSCGEMGGDEYYLWDGKKINHFACDCGVGDGGLFDNTSITFPDDIGGIKNKIILTSVSGEIDPSVDQDNDTLNSGIQNYRVLIMEYNGDSLVEAPSLHLTLRNYIKKHFPSYSLIHYDFCKVNLDSINDVIFLIGRNGEGENSNATQTIIGYSLTDSTGNYSLPIVNRDIVKNGYFTVNYEIKNNQFNIISKYNLGMYSSSDSREENKNAAFSKFTYQFDSKINSFIWTSKTEGNNINTDGYNVKWGNIKTEYFKTKKIRFEQSWESSSFEQEQNNEY